MFEQGKRKNTPTEVGILSQGKKPPPPSRKEKESESVDKRWKKEQKTGGAEKYCEDKVEDFNYNIRSAMRVQANSQAQPLKEVEQYSE